MDCAICLEKNINRFYDGFPVTIGKEKCCHRCKCVLKILDTFLKKQDVIDEWILSYVVKMCNHAKDFQLGSSSSSSS